MRLVDGTIATLANQGDAEILRMILSGNNAFVIAYAVANLPVLSALEVPDYFIQCNLQC